MVRHIFIQLAGLALATLLSAGCGQAWAAKVTTGSAGLDAVRSLDVYKDDSTIELLLAGPRDGHMTIRYLRSTDGGANWSAPVAVDSGNHPAKTIHRGNDARIAASGKRLIAVWPTEGSGWGGAGPMTTAFSEDGGKTWHPGPDPAHGGHAGEAFIDIAADNDGHFDIVWLDSSTGQQGLHFARSRDGGRHWSPAATLDTATCECCWNTLRLASADRLYVLYRNIDPRDMGLAVSTDNGASWQQRGPVGAFDWHYKGCPHTGGGLVVTGKANNKILHAIVWTGKQGQVGLHYLVSRDEGHSWTASQRLGGENARHADLAALDSKHLAAVWDTTTSAESAIFAARSSDGGKTWSAPTQLSASGVNAIQPRIVAVTNGYRVFWTQKPGVWASVWLGAKAR